MNGVQDRLVCHPLDLQLMNQAPRMRCELERQFYAQQHLRFCRASMSSTDITVLIALLADMKSAESALSSGLPQRSRLSIGSPHIVGSDRLAGSHLVSSFEPVSYLLSRGMSCC